MKNKEKGFTLAEILVVIVILATMAALVIPRLTGQPERAAVAEAVAHLSAIRQANEAYALDHGGTYSTNIGDLDVAAPTNKFSYALDGSGDGQATRQGSGCTITLTKAGAFGGTHRFRPQADGTETCL